MVSDYFHRPLKPENIIHSWSGIRPLLDDGSSALSAISREHKIDLNTSQPHPFINIFGGKLTTYRLLAEQTMDLLTPYFPKSGGHWTAKRPLPGGDFPEGKLTKFLESLGEDYPWLPSQLALRYAQSYGTLTYSLLNSAESLVALGQHFGHGLYEKELEYLIQKEWAVTADDILWRRSKLGLFFSQQEKEALSLWIETYHRSMSA